MKYTALILAAALPFAASAEKPTFAEVEQRKDALATFADTEQDQFRSKACYSAIKNGAGRAAMGLHVHEYRATQIAMHQAKTATSCEVGPHGLLIYGEQIAEGRLTCREVVWISWAGYQRREYVCNPIQSADEEI